MGRLSNLEFVQCILDVKSGVKIPAGLPTEDQGNLELAAKFLLYRNKSPMEIIGTRHYQKEIGDIMGALDKLRPVEKQIIYSFLACGYPIDFAARNTYRSEHHGINSLRDGLTNIRKIMENKASASKR